MYFPRGTKDDLYHLKKITYIGASSIHNPGYSGTGGAIGGAGANSGGACAQWSMGGSFPGKKKSFVQFPFRLYRFRDLEFKVCL